jgi:hypothetical protein
MRSASGRTCTPSTFDGHFLMGKSTPAAENSWIVASTIPPTRIQWPRGGQSSRPAPVIFLRSIPQGSSGLAAGICKSHPARSFAPVARSAACEALAGGPLRRPYVKSHCQGGRCVSDVATENLTRSRWPFARKRPGARKGLGGRATRKIVVTPRLDPPGLVGTI